MQRKMSLHTGTLSPSLSNTGHKIALDQERETGQLLEHRATT